MTKQGFLSGIRVIDCSLLGPAALAGHLVDFGAEVIKIESPAGDYGRQMTWPIVEGESLLHHHINRGKKSVVLDLRTTKARRSLPNSSRPQMSSSKRCAQVFSTRSVSASRS